MLTVIYVYEPATLTIAVGDSRDERATIRRYDGRMPAREIRELRAQSAAALEPGVYAVLSRKALQIVSTRGRIETATLTKDDWPDPPSLQAGASMDQLRTFFASLEKGGDVDDGPAPGGPEGG
jgi:hypothetical protein